MAIKIPTLSKINNPKDPDLIRLQQNVDQLVQQVYRLGSLVGAQKISVTLDPDGTGADTPVNHGLGHIPDWIVGTTSAPTMVSTSKTKNPLPDQQLLLTSSAAGPINCTIWVS